MSSIVSVGHVIKTDLKQGNGASKVSEGQIRHAGSSQKLTGR